LQEIFLQKPSIIAKYRYKIWLKSPFGPPKNFQLQAGTYTVAKDTFLGDIFITTLTRPDSQDRSITLLPGWNIWDIEMYLQQENILS
jgi:cell division protein YceG involved in septum cleavage